MFQTEPFQNTEVCSREPENYWNLSTIQKCPAINADITQHAYKTLVELRLKVGSAVRFGAGLAEHFIASDVAQLRLKVCSEVTFAAYLTEHFLASDVVQLRLKVGSAVRFGAGLAEHFIASDVVQLRLKVCSAVRFTAYLTEHFLVGTWCNFG